MPPRLFRRTLRHRVPRPRAEDGQGPEAGLRGPRRGRRLVYKSSFDKANRSAGDSFRGLGMEKGLAILSEVKERTDLPILTDVHEPEQCEVAAEVARPPPDPGVPLPPDRPDPGGGGDRKALNVKKGQFLAPDDCAQILAKCVKAGNRNVMLCERGTTFGYHNLVVDSAACR